MLAESVVARLDTAVPALSKRVEGALSLAELLRRKALPNFTPAAFVVPNGIAGRRAQSSDSIFLQDAEELVSVVLVVRTAGDVRGAKGQASLNELIWAVIAALCGWAPEAGELLDAIGVLELRRGRVTSLDAGTVFYQLDFALLQQVRITG